MGVQIKETRHQPGAYDMIRAEAIVDHPEHGRLYISEGYGGEPSLCGGAYRWRHGFAAKLLPGDTFAGLEAEPWNDHMSAYDALRGCVVADGRESLPWSGSVVERCADAWLGTGEVAS